ncbi:AraC family transcriptional regulator [Spirosoma sp. BT702]|uniref:AraC family transcriptional regulator n=1 Tax=Spirosoma profusum TaxID=2771354 RepID=A0A927AVT2_9BACT|nr:helix-turn-helix domain-containing protein [Spirosoma profusum]MBD2705358.1 AraC family transcriptional regulator [Spirosoma profusum]
MIHTYIQPSAHLRDYIKVYMLLHFQFSPNDPVPIKPFPASPNQGITFYPRGFLTAHHPDEGKLIRRPQTVIFGQQVKRLNLQLAQQEYIMFDVSFQPGILAKFLRHDLGEFVNQNTDAEAVIGREIRSVNDQLANADTYQEMVNIIEHYLWKRIQQVQMTLLPLDKASRWIIPNVSNWSLERWADNSCLSISQFERKFREQVGVSPKLFTRIIRFDNAFRLKEANPHLDWLSVALQTGYHDYQHLVKDFKQFSGDTPNTLLKENDHSPERWLGLI